MITIDREDALGTIANLQADRHSTQQADDHSSMQAKLGGIPEEAAATVATGEWYPRTQMFILSHR
jgi:hypothetical protein